MFYTSLKSCTLKDSQTKLTPVWEVYIINETLIMARNPKASGINVS